MTEPKAVTISSETFVRWILMLIVVYVLFILRNILLLILVSIVIASFVESGVRFFARFKIRRQLSVPIIFLIVIAIVVSVVYSFIPIIFRELSGVLTLISQYLPSSVDSSSIQGATNLVTMISNHTAISGLLGNIKDVASSLSNGVTGIIGTTFGGVVDTLLVLVMSFYLSIQDNGIPTLLRLLTPVDSERYVLDLWKRTQYKIGLWFQGQLLLGLIMGVITYIFMRLFGIQYSFLIAVVTGIAELIPFGVIFASIPAIIFAAIDGGLLLSVKILIYYVLAQQVENYALNPLVVRRVVGIPPLIVLLAFLIGITLAGFLGAIIAIPVTVFILEYIGDLEKKKSIVKVADNDKPRALKKASEIV